MYYEVTGQGPPLILVAGTSMDHQAWGFQLPAYAAHFTTVTLDNRGAGQTDAPKDPASYSVALMAQDTIALMDNLGIAQAHVSGLSLGSAIAQELAQTRPDRVLSLQLHGTWGRSDAWLREAFVNPMMYALDRGDRRFAFKLGQALIMSPYYLEHRGPPPVAEMVSRCLITNPHLPSDDGFRGQLHADATHDTLDRLHSIRVPTLITVGEVDMNTPPRYAREVQERISDSRLHIFRGLRASHCSFWELADEFNEVSRTFLLTRPI
jgi:pimeloyl-ACP methyl ester carboxylesterase